MEKQITVKGALPYNKIRSDCYAIKNGSRYIMSHYARKITTLWHFDSADDILVLIPIPGHTGKATTALMLCEHLQCAFIKKGHSCIILDALKTRSHNSLCYLKKNNKEVSGIEFNTRYKDIAFKETLETMRADKRYKIFLVDNVIDTGHTVREIFKLTGNLPVIAVGDTARHTYTKLVTENSFNYHKTPDGKLLKILGHVQDSEENWFYYLEDGTYAPVKQKETNK